MFEQMAISAAESVAALFIGIVLFLMFSVLFGLEVEFTSNNNYS